MQSHELKNRVDFWSVVQNSKVEEEECELLCIVLLKMEELRLRASQQEGRTV